MTIQVYRGVTPKVELNLEQAVFSYGKMEVRELVFSTEASSVLDIQIGDTLTYQGERMKMNYTPNYTNAGKKRRNYTITFEGREADMIDQPLVHEGDVTFSYYGDAVDLMNLLLDNLGDGWTAGDIDDVEPEAFEFDNVNCLSALSVIAEKFGLEWKVAQKVITLKKDIGIERSVTLSQGRGNGLYSLTREYLKDSNIVTRAYALGGTENLPEGSDGKRLSLDDYIDKNTAVYGIKIRYYTFDDIFPRRTGTATAVSKVNDKSYTITDTSIDFDINGQRAGENEVKIVFKSGALNGQEFVVTRYNHTTKTITYKANEDAAGKLMPYSVTVAEEGDKYTLVGLIMPSTYVDAAKAELRLKRAEALNKDSVPKVVYSLNSDVLFLKQNGLLLAPGDIIRVQDSDIDLDELLTIQRVSYPAIFPDRLITGMQFTAEVGNTSYAKLSDKLYEDGQKQIIINAELRKQNAELARGNALRMRELQNLIFDADDYFDPTHIKPQSIETQMLAIGAKSQNFFLSAVTMQPNYQGNPNSFFVSGGQLQHREISIAAGFIWVLNQQLFNGLDASKSYYLSAKCNKTQLIGTYNLTAEPIKVEQEDGFYNFNVGVLYPVKDGKRFFANTAGVTYVVGNQINTGRIQSMDGQTWFDLDTGEIQGTIKFKSGQSVESAIQLAENNAIQQSANDASNKADEAKQYADLLVSEIEVGKRNFLRKSQTVDVFAIYGVTGDLENVKDIGEPSGQSFKVTNIDRVQGLGDQVFYIPIMNNPWIIDRQHLLNKEVTVSFRAKTNGVHNLIFFNGTAVKPTAMGVEWNDYAFKLTMEATGNWHFRISGDNLKTLYVSSIKVELGSESTYWKIANEDVQDAIDEAKALALEADRKRQELADSLKSLAYLDVVEVAKLGSSVMEGGYFQNTLIDTVWLKANIINASEIVVNGGGVTQPQLAGAINSIDIGYTNLIDNGDFNAKTNVAGQCNSSFILLSEYGDVRPFVGNKFLTASKDNAAIAFLYFSLDKNIYVKPLSEYVFSFSHIMPWSSDVLNIQITEFNGVENTYTQVTVPTNVSRDWGERSVIKFTTKADTKSVNFRFDAYTGTWLLLDGVKLEVGNVATPWSPSLYDTSGDIRDTRDDNQLPPWYYETYPSQIVREFKRASVIGIYGIAEYAELTTNIPWGDTSGGEITQTARIGLRSWVRAGGGTWSPWIEAEDKPSAQGRVDGLRNSLGSLAYDNLVEQSKLGTTVMQGGYLRTELINVTSLFAQYIEATNLMVTGNSKIGVFNIETRGLTTTRYSSTKTNGIGISDTRIYTHYGPKSSFPQIVGSAGVSFGGMEEDIEGFEVATIRNSLSRQTQNIALTLIAGGSTTSNTALDILSGDIRVKGKTGENAFIRIDNGNGGYTELEVVNGLIVNYR